MLWKKRNTTPGDALRDGDLRKMCHVYLHREKPVAIVATMFLDGPYCESDDAVSVCDTDDAAALGEIVKSRFMASRRETIPNSRARKKSDWPAFKASGLRSVKQFQQEFVPISVMGANEANIIVRLEGPEISGALRLTCHCNPLLTDTLGAELKNILAHVKAWEALAANAADAPGG